MPGPLSRDLGVADYNGDGLEESSDIYWEGVADFYGRLREELGQHRVLTANMDWNFLNFINGANQEGLARPSDPWNEVSRTVNEMLTWQRLSPLPFVSIAFVQYLTNQEDLLFVQMHRLLNGYSACLGMAAGMKLGDGLEELTRVELFKGVENQPHWLGKSFGEPKRPATLTANLLGNRSPTGGWEDMIPNMVPKRGVLKQEGDELVLRAEGKQVGFLTLDLFFDLKQNTDFVVYLDVMSGGNEQEIVTREIMKPIVSVKYETGPIRTRISNVDFTFESFYVRGAEKGERVKFSLRFQEWDDVRFRSIAVHAAPDTLACEFENGVVLVNPSLEDETLDLTTIFPGRSGYKHLKAADPSGLDKIDVKYNPQVRQAMDINNGQEVNDPKKLEVLQRNSVFLIANRSTVDDEPTTSPTSPPTTINTNSPTLPPTSIATKITVVPTTKPSSRPATTPTTGPTEERTTSPTTPPTAPSCVDESGKHQIHKKNRRKKCAWLKKKNGKHLAKNCGTADFEITPLGRACPATCNNCS
uniref:Uncharacterized protein n=1 Tax=Ditylum brightwellii TaxID=49249 RepID=A0A7S4RZZ6_9STRA